MADQKIEFRKNRAFGENLNDSFLFIKYNLKHLLQSIFAITALFMLTQAIFNGLYQSRVGSIWTALLQGRNSSQFRGSDIFNFQYFMVILFALLTYISLQVALTAYVKYYLENDGKKPGIEEVWNIFIKYFFRIILYNIPLFLLIIAGCFFCLAPGIYLWVVFVPFTTIAMIEDKGFSDTFSRCFELIKENFWMSLGLYVVAYFIYNISSAIVGLVVSAVIGLVTYLTSKSLSATMAIVTSFLNIFSFCFYIIFLVSATLNYFTLVEIKDGTGILNRINNIGKKNNDYDNVEEEY